MLTVAAAGDLGALLQSSGIAPADAAKVVTALTPLVDVAHLKTGEKVRLGFLTLNGTDAPGVAAPAADGALPAADPKLIRASIYQDGAHLATVARADDDSFIRADEPTTSLDAIATTAVPTRLPPPAARRASTTPSTPPRWSSRSPSRWSTS